MHIIFATQIDGVRLGIYNGSHHCGAVEHEYVKAVKLIYYSRYCDLLVVALSLEHAHTHQPGTNVSPSFFSSVVDLYIGYIVLRTNSAFSFVAG
jgi:hypothetical protein